MARVVLKGGARLQHGRMLTLVWRVQPFLLSMCMRGRGRLCGQTFSDYKPKLTLSSVNLKCQSECDSWILGGHLT